MPISSGLRLRRQDFGYPGNQVLHDLTTDFMTHIVEVEVGAVPVVFQERLCRMGGILGDHLVIPALGNEDGLGVVLR